MFLTKNVLEAGALRYIPLKQNATQRNNNRNPGGLRDMLFTRFATSEEFQIVLL